MSDVLNAYAHLTQGKNEMAMQYLARAKVLLGYIHHTSKLCDIQGSDYDSIYLVWALCSPHIQRWVASKQDTGGQ